MRGVFSASKSGRIWGFGHIMNEITTREWDSEYVSTVNLILLLNCFEF